MVAPRAGEEYCNRQNSDGAELPGSDLIFAITIS